MTNDDAEKKKSLLSHINDPYDLNRSYGNESSQVAITPNQAFF